MINAFSYEEAFSRNLGWVTEKEQARLRQCKVAIAGMGGVGGIHLITLARLGIGRFHIADFDTFDYANFNRQAGAGCASVGLPKVEIMANRARDINPQIDLRLFPEGVIPDNIDAFLEDVDLYVDGLDFFAFAAREMLFAACAERGIPAVTVAPLGMSAALLNFLPGQMTFEDYFQLQGRTEDEKSVRFLLGLAPAALQIKYLADPSRVQLAARKGPSTAMACQLCAGVAATEALKILLNRGGVKSAPHGVQFDAYRNRLAHTWRPGGNRNPLQKLLIAVAQKRLGQMGTAPTLGSAREYAHPLESILDLARWAPSGDNVQPWRFEIKDDDHVVIHGFDTRRHVVYDIDGRPSQLALGGLLETIDIAASGHGLRTESSLRADSDEEHPVIDVWFRPDAERQASPLRPFIAFRSVQRRPLRSRPLTPKEKRVLSASVGDGYEIVWLEGTRSRWEMAKLLFSFAKLRLTMPEAYRVHRDVIQWRTRYSEDRIPDQAVGLDRPTLRLMEWVMKSWSRVHFFNRFLAGTLAPRLQLDLIPGVACAAHFVLVTKTPAASIPDYLDAGGAMQRFWLTATQLGLQLQPEMTPLIFSKYVDADRALSKVEAVNNEARKLVPRFDQLVGREARQRAVFMGRIGAGRDPVSRSLRRPLSELLVKTAPPSIEDTQIISAPPRPGP